MCSLDMKFGSGGYALYYKVHFCICFLETILESGNETPREKDEYDVTFSQYFFEGEHAGQRSGISSTYSL
jgi:hypothetical protein